jgi:hypothetical protein
MTPTEQHPLIGQFVIVRGRNSGVYAAMLTAVAPTTMTLMAARRLWKWKTKTGISLNDLATGGIDVSESKISAPSTVVVERSDVCEVIACPGLVADLWSGQ